MRQANRPRRIPLLVATVIAALLVVATEGTAQPDRKSTGLFKAMPHKRDEPVTITSATLEVRDKSKIATFSGDVLVVQGDTEVRCDTLVVFYDNDQKDKSGSKKAGSKKMSSKKTSSKKTADGGTQQIRRMEAKGSVVVTQRDQRAVGDRADFDMRTNTVTLTGNVVVTSAENVVRGHRMVVDLNTGVTRMGTESGGGRVEGIFNSKASPKPGKQP